MMEEKEEKDDKEMMIKSSILTQELVVDRLT